MATANPRHESQAALRLAALEFKKSCGLKPAYVPEPVLPPPAERGGTPWAFVVGILFAIFALAIIAAGCASMVGTGEAIQGVGAAIQSAGAVHPVAFPVGLVVSAVGAVVAAIGKAKGNAPAIAAGLGMAVGGVGAEGVLRVSDPAAIVAPAETEPATVTGTAR